MKNFPGNLVYQIRGLTEDGEILSHGGIVCSERTNPLADLTFDIKTFWNNYGCKSFKVDIWEAGKFYGGSEH